MASFLAWRDERRGCGHAWSRHRSCFVSTPFAALRAVSLFALFPPVKSPSASFVPVQNQGFKRFCCLLFKIRVLRQESPIAVQLQFGAWSPQNGASTPMKIAANSACLHLIALNSLLYARATSSIGGGNLPIGTDRGRVCVAARRGHGVQRPLEHGNKRSVLSLQSDD